MVHSDNDRWANMKQTDTKCVEKCEADWKSLSASASAECDKRVMDCRIAWVVTGDFVTFLACIQNVREWYWDEIKKIDLALAACIKACSEVPPKHR